MYLHELAWTVLIYLTFYDVYIVNFVDTAIFGLTKQSLILVQMHLVKSNSVQLQCSRA